MFADSLAVAADLSRDGADAQPLLLEIWIKTISLSPFT
jgi:hypothetical protein